MRIYLVRIPRRKGHSIQRVVLPGFDHFWPKPAASTVTFELAQTGGISSCNKATQIEQPAPNLASSVSSLVCCRYGNDFHTSTIPLAWAEGRALLRSNSSAVPGAKTEWGGTMPPSSIRDWHQSAKSRGLGGSPALRLSCRREFSALGIRLAFAQHVPDDGGQLSHHRHARDGGSPSAFEGAISNTGLLEVSRSAKGRFVQFSGRSVREETRGHPAAARRTSRHAAMAVTITRKRLS
jgi:hypothetical protein